jgi:hypothetical protein
MMTPIQQLKLPVKVIRLSWFRRKLSGKLGFFMGFHDAVNYPATYKHE